MIRYADCAKLKVKEVACLSSDIEPKDKLNEAGLLTVTRSVEKIPACVGIKPQVTSSRTDDAQKTDQCLHFIRQHEHSMVLKYAR